MIAAADASAAQRADVEVVAALDDLGDLDALVGGQVVAGGIDTDPASDRGVRFQPGVAGVGALELFLAGRGKGFEASLSTTSASL